MQIYGKNNDGTQLPNLLKGNEKNYESGLSKKDIENLNHYANL